MTEPVDRDLLIASAPLARAWAAEGCWRDDNSGEGCQAYHAVWQYLRIIGVVTTLDHHAHLYTEALQGFAADPARRRVLLSGSADYGLLAIVAAAFRQIGAEPAVTLVDRCETPLKLARWYGEKRGLKVETRQADLLTYESETRFDTICVHSLLGLVRAEDRPLLTRRWHDLLTPGGRVLCVNAISPAHHPAQVRYSAERRAEHRRRVEEAAQACRDSLDIAPETLGEMAFTYSGTVVSNVIRSRAEITALFEDAGLVIEEQRFGRLGVDDGHHFSGPTPPEKREYAWVIARRP